MAIYRRIEITVFRGAYVRFSGPAENTDLTATEAGPLDRHERSTKGEALLSEVLRLLDAGAGPASGSGTQDPRPMSGGS